MRDMNLDIGGLVILEGNLYQADIHNKSIEIGTVLFDARKESFTLIQSNEGLAKHAYLPPEAYVVFKKVDYNEITS